MLMDMELLDLQTDEMEAIKRTRNTYDFPTVSIRKNAKSCVAYFNTHARKILDGYAYTRVYANAEYVVFQFTNKKDCHSFKINRNNLDGRYICCSELRRLPLIGKTFKMYNTKKGFAIKINEPLKK